MSASDLGIEAPRAIARPFMIQRWRDLSFLHWPCEAASVRALLPSGLEPDVFDGAAWVGVIPFHLTVRVPAWAPHVPWFASTAEVNVRTYVVGPDGRRGIWFFSLDAARLAAVLVARAWYAIPYRWADTRMSSGGGTVRYASRRHRARSTRFRATIVPDAEVHALDELERFLICRWRLYTPSRPGGLSVSEIDHEPWPVRRARASGVDEGLIAAAGLRRPDVQPLVHFSDGVTARWVRSRCVVPPAASGLPGLGGRSGELIPSQA